MANKYLVIVRAGDESKHCSWTDDINTRNWDLIINYYGDQENKYQEDDATVIYSKGTKYPALYDLIREHSGLFGKYAYIFLPDDDLLMSQSDISRIFEIASGYNLSLCQPSLSWDSYHTYGICLHNPKFAFRTTNFVEVMAPCFESRYLHLVLDSFPESRSGWGLDLAWPTIIGAHDGTCAIIDDVVIKHPRALGSGEIYKHLKKHNNSPNDDLASIIGRYNIDPARENWLTKYGGIDCGGLDKGNKLYPVQRGRLSIRHLEFITRLALGISKQPGHKLKNTIKAAASDFFKKCRISAS